MDLTDRFRHSKIIVAMPRGMVFAIVVCLSYILIESRSIKKLKNQKHVPKKIKNTGGSKGAVPVLAQSAVEES